MFPLSAAMCKQLESAGSTDSGDIACLRCIFLTFSRSNWLYSARSMDCVVRRATSDSRRSCTIWVRPSHAASSSPVRFRFSLERSPIHFLYSFVNT